MANSGPAIAQELERLKGAGRPVAADELADLWAASGSLDRADASRLAVEYVRALHDELLKIDGFGALFALGSTVTIAEVQQRAEASARAQEEQEVAATYNAAADNYVHAALSQLDGRTNDARRSAYDAESLFEQAELTREWRIIEKFKDLRLQFGELVEDRYDAFAAVYETADETTAEAALEALKQGAKDFKALVRTRLFEVNAPIDG